MGNELKQLQFNRNINSFVCFKAREVNFPGYPAPPLEQMMHFCMSIQGWLNADSQNIGAVHCQVCISSFFSLKLEKKKKKRTFFEFLGKLF